VRDEDRYYDSYRGDAAGSQAYDVNYDENGADDEDYRMRQVCYPQYTTFTRADDLRHPQQYPRYYDGMTIRAGPEDLPPETGERDLSTDQEPLKYVLVRQLKPSVTEELFAKGMEKFYEGFDDSKGGAEPRSLRCVYLVKDRRSKTSIGYGFAEYHTVRDARQAVEKAMLLTNEKRCTIASAPIKVDFPHKGIFPPIVLSKRSRPDEFAFTRPQTGGQHIYYDERFYVRPYVVNAEPSTTTSKEDQPPAEPKASKSGTKRAIETLESKAKKPKTSTKAVPSQLQLWNNKNAELHEGPDTTIAEQTKQPATGFNALQASAPREEIHEEVQTFAAQGQGDSYSCWLCKSNFTSLKHIHEHLNRSKNHASNLKDDKIIQRGYECLRKEGIDPEGTLKLPRAPAEAAMAHPENGDGSQYRDRAAERRKEDKIAGKSNEKITGFSLKGTNPKTKIAGVAPASALDSSASKPTYGKGKNLLQKAGWSEGDSLGAGNGITAPIDQSLYAAGVGLGHQSSKKGDAVEEASRMTKNDPNSFSEKTKELARKRYEETIRQQH